MLFFRVGLLEVVAVHVLAEAAAALAVFSIFAWHYLRVFRPIKSQQVFLLPGLLKKYGQWVIIRYGFSRVTKNVMPWLVKFFINTEAVAFYSLALNAVAFLESFMPLAGLSSILGLKADNRNEMAFIFKRSYYRRFD